MYSSFTVGCMQFRNPAFCYWHQTLWPPFSLSIEIMVYGMYFYRGCIASLSFQTIITPFREIAILLKILEFSILGYLYCICFFFFFSQSLWASWMNLSECDDALYCRDYHSTALSQKLYIGNLKKCI